MTDNKLKRTLAILIFFAPLTAMAHGLSTIVLEFGLSVVFLFILVLIKMRIEGKLIIGGVYLLATYLTDNQIDNLPYRQNMTLINILVAIIPSTVFLVSYFILKKRFRKAE